MNTDLIFLVKKAMGNLKPSQFALYSGLTQGALSRILNGSRKPTPETLQKIAAKATNGVTYNDLMRAAGYLPHFDSGFLSQDETETVKKAGGFDLSDSYITPLIGSVVAGFPIMSEENLEGFIYTSYKPQEEYFALRVFGDSMTDDGITDGSIVIVHKCSEPENGDTVVALLNGDEATVKNYKKTKDGTVLLLPANNNYEPIILTGKSNVYILGVVVEIRTEKKRKR